MGQPVIREKTLQAMRDHLAAALPTHTRALMGDSHFERLVWKHPHLAPPDTWICGCGGDRVFQLQRRVQGYVDDARAPPDLTHVALLIGSNDVGARPIRPADLDRLVEGVTDCVARVRARWPAARVAVVPVPPVPESGAAARSQAAVNALNTRLDPLRAGFATWDGVSLRTGFEDHVHLSPEGYARLRRALDAFFALPAGAEAVPPKSPPSAAEASPADPAPSDDNAATAARLEDMSPADLDRRLAEVHALLPLAKQAELYALQGEKRALEARLEEIS